MSPASVHASSHQSWAVAIRRIARIRIHSDSDYVFDTVRNDSGFYCDSLCNCTCKLNGSDERQAGPCSTRGRSMDSHSLSSPPKQSNCVMVVHARWCPGYRLTLCRSLSDRHGPVYFLFSRILYCSFQDLKTLSSSV